MPEARVRLGTVVAAFARIREYEVPCVRSLIDTKVAATFLAAPRRLLALGGILAIPVLLCPACGPEKRKEPPGAKLGPMMPAVPNPNAPGAKPVDPSETTRPVEAREVIVPELKLPGLWRPVSFDSRGQPLSLVIRKWSDDSKVSIALHPELLKRASARNFTVWLKVDGMPAKDALEWICRLCDAWYLVLDHGIFLVPDYRWAASEDASLGIDLVGGLYHGQGLDLAHFLDSSLAVFLKNNPACRITLRPSSGRLLAVVPEAGHDIIRKVIRELQTHAPFRVHRDQLPSSIVLPPEPEPAPRVINARIVKERMARIIQAFYRDASPQKILADIVDRTGIGMAFDARKVPKGRRSVTLNLGYVPARTLLNELVQRCYLGRVVIEPERGLWLYPAGELRDHPKTRHSPWQRVTFRSYPARDLIREKRKGGDKPKGDGPEEEEASEATPEKLINYVIDKVGGAWNEEAYAIGYNRPTGRLLLQHEIRVHRRIPIILSGYRRTLKALGKPVHLQPPGTGVRQ